MLKIHNFSRKSGIFLAMIIAPIMAFAAPFSKNGVIQNVQNYSNNPFYNPSTGTFTTPHLVYNSGPALKASDCQSMVTSLIHSTCAGLNNCKNKSLADIRPTLLIQLSKLDGYNYASSCGGYIDTIFADYKKSYSNTTNSVVAGTAFPTVATTAASATTTTSAKKLPQWKSEYNERAAELKALQDETNEIPSGITKTAFPTTFNELSLAEKNEIKQQGYAPYKDAKAYVPLDIEINKQAYKTTADAQNDDCKSVYACLGRFNKAEKSAETACVNTLRANDSTDIENLCPDLITAWGQSIVAPCSCTHGLRFRDKLLQDMGILSVSTSTATDTPDMDTLNKGILEKCNEWETKNAKGGTAKEEVKSEITTIGNELKRRLLQLNGLI